MLRASLLGLLLLTACSAPPPTSPSMLGPSDVLELAALPPGYRAGEVVSERCRGSSGLRPIHEERLADVDCSIERLSRVLRARAAEQGSRVLVEKRCKRRGRGRVSVQCRATIAHASSSVVLGAPQGEPSAPAPSAARVQDLDDPHPRQSGGIRVSFVPSTQRRYLPARAYHRVDETAEPSVGRALLGQVSARCEDCDDRSLRHALRVTAGRVGAGEVASVRCFDDEGEGRCIGTALEPWSF